MGHILIWLFRALLFSFLVCGALAYVLIILYDSQEIDDSIKDHVEKEFVSDGNVSKIPKKLRPEIPGFRTPEYRLPLVDFRPFFRKSVQFSNFEIIFILSNITLEARI